MWCGKCQAEVAAEVSPDNQRVFCAVCGTLLSMIDLPPQPPASERTGDRTKEARELLQRWSSGQFLDPFGPIVTTAKTPRTPEVAAEKNAPRPLAANTETTLASFATSSPPTAVPQSAETDDARTSPVVSSAQPAPAAPRPTWEENVATILSRPGAANPAVEGVVAALTNPLAVPTDSTRTEAAPVVNPLIGTNDAAAATSSPPLAPPANVNIFRVDAAHPADHFASGAKSAMTPRADQIGPFAAKVASPESKRDTKRSMLWFPTWDPAVWRSEPTATSGWAATAGQFLAYAGVLAMTAGACLVVWSYFGGPAHYAPTGWLLATAGQMLLFFGVVTLVSSGLEQTTEQVNKRIEQLGDHIIRIEQASREMSLRGGAVPPAHFGSDSNAAMSPRAAASGYERSVVEE